nr:DUF2087 domain-containing protein [uncultured Devosia sp.]
MSKLHVPFSVPDITTLARSLREQLGKLDHAPSHVEMLNMLARANGHANFQHLRADAQAQSRLSTVPAEERVDHARVEKVLRHFNDAGTMIRWPSKTNHQTLCLWVIWSRIPADRRFSEREINQFIIEGHSFGDHALLRRSMIDAHMLTRTPDGRLYRRIEKKPDPDALALLAGIAQRISA